jgi:hypothetical protein
MKRPNRALVGIAVMLLGSFAAAQQSAAPALTYRFAMAEQPLSEALKQFATQTGLQLVYHTEQVSPRLIAPPISGAYTSEAALTRLLAHSDLRYYHINDKTIAIRTAASESTVTPKNNGRDTPSPKIPTSRVSAVPREATAIERAPK